MCIPILQINFAAFVVVVNCGSFSENKRLFVPLPLQCNSIMVKNYNKRRDSLY